MDVSTICLSHMTMLLELPAVVPVGERQIRPQGLLSSASEEMNITTNIILNDNMMICCGKFMLCLALGFPQKT